MATIEERTVRHSSGLSCVLTEEEYQKSIQELKPGTLVRVDNRSRDGFIATGIVREQSLDRGLTWLDFDTLNFASQSPCFATIQLTKV